MSMRILEVGGYLALLISIVLLITAATMVHLALGFTVAGLLLGFGALVTLGHLARESEPVVEEEVVV